jgi:hypothetical protein
MAELYAEVFRQLAEPVRFMPGQHPVEKPYGIEAFVFERYAAVFAVLIQKT